jgi:hypothetical protein
MLCKNIQLKISQLESGIIAKLQLEKAKRIIRSIKKNKAVWFF